MKIKIISLAFFLFTLTFLSSGKTIASEGSFNILSTQGQSMRCYVASVQMIDRYYNLLVSCRDIIYPAQGEVFSYVVWVNPIEDNKPIRLGTLGLGRAHFKTKEAFSSIFVTTEASKKPRSPTGTIVMQGSLEPIPLLEQPVTVTPTPEEEEVISPEEEMVDEQESSTRQRVVTGLRRAGLIIFVVLITIIGLIFIITRTRR